MEEKYKAKGLGSEAGTKGDVKKKRWGNASFKSVFILRISFGLKFHFHGIYHKIHLHKSVVTCTRMFITALFTAVH